MPVLAGTVYATTSDLTKLGMVGAAFANIDNATQTEALQYASAVADSYLQSHFVLPLTQWGYDLLGVVCAIAAWTLLATRGYNPQSQGDQNIRQRYEDALKWLDEVSKGLQAPINIVDSSVPPVPVDGSTATRIDGFGLVSTAVRGWTDRGVGTPVTSDDWWTR
jgi:phage gp36-like protein